jgi:hypothetical protein
MIKFKLLVFSLALTVGFSAMGQNMCFPMMGGVEDRLVKDIGILASPKLMGREPGTEGALMAAQYVASEFAKLNLRSVTSSEYYQEFSISKEVTFSKENLLVVKKDTLALFTDFFPLKYSSSSRVEGKTVFVDYGISAPDLGLDNYKKLKPKKLKDKIFVIDISSPDGVHPHSKYVNHHDLGERVKLAKQNGAKAVIFVNLQDDASDPNPSYRKIKSKDIPVVFIQNVKWAKKIKKGKEIILNTKLSERKIEAFNVVGFLNNGADETVVIGAHYDHLGWGGSSSLYAGKEKKIHYGADDNASGTAGMMEMARTIKAGDGTFNRFNYAFVAFSGEEMGLLGSSYFVKHMPKQFGRVRYMINFDMIGRMKNQELAVNGVGTSPIWEELITSKGCNGLSIKTSKSGVGPSDHTSFYYQEIPALHFFTGTHPDYHKPTDLAERINIKGEIFLISYVLKLVQQLEEVEKMEFTQTKEQSEAAPRFTVTLGVMPDYMFDGEGMKIDGVTEDKPAAKAGMKAGDIVTQMGDVKVVDMMSYMKALSRHKKGDKVEVIYQREGKDTTVKVQF